MNCFEQALRLVTIPSLRTRITRAALEFNGPLPVGENRVGLAACLSQTPATPRFFSA